LKGTIDLVVYESARPDTESFVPASQRQGLRLYERQALPLRPRDWIRIEATMSRPAYLYLVWIGADGEATPLWPWQSPDPSRPAVWTDPRDQERLLERLRLPDDAKAGANAMPLGEGPPGIEALLLLARAEPLTNDETAELAGLLAPRGRRSVRDLVLAMELENGERVTDEKDRSPIVGKGQDVGDVEEQLRSVMRQVHERFGYVRGVCFGNQGKTSP
jgi:hypothetical protein